MNLKSASGPFAAQGRWSGPVGSIDDCLANMPAPLLLSSSARGWRELTLNCHPHSGRFELDLPPLDHFVITLAQGSGTPVEHVLDGRSHRHALRPADVCIYPALRTHRCWGDSTARSLAVHLPLERLRSAAQTLSDGSHADVDIDPAYSVRDPILQHMHEILFHELQTPPHPAQPMFVAAVADAMAIHLVRSWGHPSNPAPLGAARLSTRALSLVMEYMQQNLSEPIHLGDLAAIAQLSRFHFVRAFKATTRVTPMQFLEQARISHAQGLLRKGGFSVAEVAYLVGFSDQSHFTRRFHRRVGCTPGAYAKSCRSSA